MGEIVASALAALAALLSYLNRRAVKTSNGHTIANTVEAIDAKLDQHLEEVGPLKIAFLDHLERHPGRARERAQ